MKHCPATLALALAALLIAVTLGVAPQDRAAPRLVTATGEAVVNVVPDEVVLTLGVESKAYHDWQIGRASASA